MLKEEVTRGEIKKIIDDEVSKVVKNELGKQLKAALKSGSSPDTS